METREKYKEITWISGFFLPYCDENLSVMRTQFISPTLHISDAILERCRRKEVGNLGE